MQIDSIKKRYFFKLGVGGFSALYGILMVSIVPRALGPDNYGNFGFLQVSFTNIISIISMGSTMAFFAYNAKHDDSFPAIIFYGGFAVLTCFVLLSLVVGGHVGGVKGFLWPGQSLKYIFMAALLGIVTWLANIVNGFMDSKGLTVKNEIIKAGNKVLSAFLIVILFCGGWLNLTAYFIFWYVISITVMSASIIYAIRIKAIGEIRSINRYEIKDLFKYFYAYCSPFFFYGIFGALVSYSYRWMLQKVSGSSEQAYFSLASQFSVIVLMLTTYFLPILMREMANAHGRNDFERLRSLFDKSTRLFFSLTVFLSMIFVFNSRAIIKLSVGDEYIESFWAVTLMFLYPIFQTNGQLGGTVFYSTGNTKLYTRIGYFNNIVGFLVVYYLIASKNASIAGLELGSTGLALATLLTSCMSTNILYYFACRYLRIPYMKFVFHQLIVMSSLSLLMMSAIFIADVFMNIVKVEMQILSIIVVFLIYVIFTFGLFYRFPGLLGMNKAEIDSYLNKVKSWRQLIKVKI